MPRFDSYIKLLQEIGLEPSLLYNGSDETINSKIILDTCDCKTYQDRKY